MKIEHSVLVEMSEETYLKFFGKERLVNLDFELIEHKDYPITDKYSRNWRKWKNASELLFKFFSQNTHETIEVGVIYGFCNYILGKITFINDGSVYESFVNYNQAISTTCGAAFYKSIDYRNIYYVKIIES